MAMFGDNFDLAESKLIMLYIFNKIKVPLSNLEITKIILENNFMNYFSLQNYLNDMIESGLLKYATDEDKKKITVTEEGIHVLSLFQKRIQDNKKDTIDEYLNQLGIGY
jgi:predicted transcriptional regulator